MTSSSSSCQLNRRIEILSFLLLVSKLWWFVYFAFLYVMMNPLIHCFMQIVHQVPLIMSWLISITVSFVIVLFMTETNNLFVTSKNETTNSPIHEFKVLHKFDPIVTKLIIIDLVCILYINQVYYFLLITF